MTPAKDISRIKGHHLAFAILALVAIKPILDMFWNYKIVLHGRPVSPQGIVGIAFFLLSLGISVLEATKKRTVALSLFLCSAMIILTRLALKPADAEMTLRYGASMAAVVLIPWSANKLRGEPLTGALGKLVPFSLLAVCASIFLQIAGLAPWYSTDIFFVWRGTWEIMTVGRLSGFYFHPLDLIRVLIWPYFIICFLLVEEEKSKGYRVALWGLFFLWNAFFLLMTHRLTILLGAVTIFLLCALHKKKWTAPVALILLCLAWLGGGTMIAKRANILTSEVISLNTLTTSPTTNFQSAESIRATARMSSRGRLDFWRQHIEWISGFNAGEYLFGSRRDFPRGPHREAQAHNQYLDLIERFGVTGLLFLCTTVAVGILSVPAPKSWKVATFAGLAAYSLITEPLFAPTFLWSAFLFCCAPMLWAREFNQ